MKLPTIKEVAGLIVALKKDIGDEYRSQSQEPGDETPCMDVTIGCDTETGAWSYQTGDNSFTGGAYGYPYWGVTAIDRRSNARAIARDLIDQIAEQAWEC